MSTIKDVAALANVSPSTVSRVIKKNPRISKETTQKVLDCMKQLNYVPNQAARSLVTKRSKTIGIIQKSGGNSIKQNPFLLDVLTGIHRYSESHAYLTIVTTSTSDQELMIEVQRLIQSQYIEVFILLYSKENDEIEQLLIDNQSPYVIVGKPLSKNTTLFVDNDNIVAATDLTNYLINKGHENILLLTEQSDYEVYRDRIKGYRQAMSQHQLTPQITTLALDRTNIKANLLELIRGREISAIITTDTMLNMMVISVLYELNIRIPEDIKTATFNDSFLNAFASPPQTAVDVFPEQLGRTAVRLLTNKLEQNDLYHCQNIISTRIVERDSTI
ncbi:LacI family DNA-binding transcriptional regulator [Staphylococcus gallinarum]|uniref:LacI family DNA-binding transcriptional regulator n=1 Tax=Staphylococcus gallinarum TaxID=1293 RepID=A0A3A0W381_STAGA|nr:LacI family DNA-binding transcriptional regulator [Staphylococcus gallinarum]RIP34269.1 LacI family DNA-binding transcriptional regulator [Staphylococcus gallinarum]